MRQFNFRAWNTQNSAKPFMEYSRNSQIWGIRRDSVAELVMMQGTGMRDKNGREVYEDDVVQRTCLDEHCDLQHVGRVVYSPKWCMYGIEDKTQDRSETGDYLVPLAYGDPGNNMRVAVEVLGTSMRTPSF